MYEVLTNKTVNPFQSWRPIIFKIIYTETLRFFKKNLHKSRKNYINQQTKLSSFLNYE